MKRVYFDARMIDHPGIGRYIRCLLPLIAEDTELDVQILGDRDKIKKFLGVERSVIDFNYSIYSIQEQVGFLKLKKIIKNDILHIPHYNVPIMARFNLVVTIHDIIHILYPEGASDRFAPLYMRFMVKRILKTAKAVICVSQATKNEIEERLLLPPKSGGIVMTEKKRDNPEQGLRLGLGRAEGQSPFFSVIYEGIDKSFVKITDIAYLKNIKEKYKLPGRFLLYVGSIRRHKNIAALLDSFQKFKEKVTDAHLVMVGRLSQDIDIDRNGVTYLGEIESDKELAAIYNLASCLLNLSLYEGFGLTILEAQRCGLPVVCSDIPVHKEIGGEAIAAINPSYIDQIDENLYNVLFNNTTRESLISKGLENTKRFDWQSTAKNTINTYRKICNEGSDSSRLAAGHARRREDT
ncbi:MAG: hypothetical protein A3C51_06700 [Omnitrophica bacterium RIFCSPHIGHO2_02_FULL_46_20]|nr:MAG: hypothetical protein A3C51_06700 [Omnitrophica bacterium RIFCSPHIGHO2_02_FULL_46_20]